MRRKGTADVDALRTVEVVASFQLDSLVVVGSCHAKTPVCVYLDVQCFSVSGRLWAFPTSLSSFGHNASSACL